MVPDLIFFSITIGNFAANTGRGSKVNSSAPGKHFQEMETVQLSVSSKPVIFFRQFAQ